MKPLMIAPSFELQRHFAVLLLPPHAASAREPNYLLMLKLWIQLGRLWRVVRLLFMSLPKMMLAQQTARLIKPSKSIAAR